MDLHNCARHWTGNHEFCRIIDPERSCVKENWGPHHAYFLPNGAAHEALEKWLEKHITRAKMSHYLRARENYLSETFHSLINKYATKRIHWQESHYARLACTALDWNKNRGREVLHTLQRTTSVHTAPCRRPMTYRVLAAKIENWKDKVARKFFG